MSSLSEETNAKSKIENAVAFSIAEKSGRKQHSNQEEEYLQYLDGVQTPVVAIDLNFGIIYMNDFCTRMLGVSSLKEAIGKKCYDFFKTTDCHTERCACSRAMKTKETATSQTTAKPGQTEIQIQYTG